MNRSQGIVGNSQEQKFDNILFSFLWSLFVLAIHEWLFRTPDRVHQWCGSEPGSGLRNASRLNLGHEIDIVFKGDI